MFYLLILFGIHRTARTDAVILLRRRAFCHCAICHFANTLSRINGNLCPVPVGAATVLTASIADLLVRVAFGKIFTDVVTLEFVLFLLVRLLLRHYLINCLIVQRSLLRQLFQANALCVGRRAVVQFHCVSNICCSDDCK